MNRLTGKLILLICFVLILGAPLLMKRDAKTVAPRDTNNALRLVILTPHNEQTRYEFAQAFNDQRIRRNLPPVMFDWRSSGGTSDLRNQVLSQLEAAYRHAHQQGRTPKSIGYDLFFGGGAPDHNILAKGVRLEHHDKNISATVPIHLPRELVKQVFPSSTIGGEPLYHPQFHWVGVALSSFGIVYNRDVLSMLDLPEPRSWMDLVEEEDGRYLGWIALADPSHSGSITATYNVVLRRYGWTEGWKILRRIFANARYFAASASKAPQDVAEGDAAAGMCIDFYGRHQSGAVGRTPIGEPRVGYVDPQRETVIVADPISIIEGAPHEALAREFVIWLLSSDAQQRWQRRKGVVNGPKEYELRRLPVRRDVYTAANMADWTDPVDPFAIAASLAPTTPDYFRAVAPISHAMAVDIHDDLVAAWRAVVEHPGHPRRAEMLALFDKMPDELATMTDQLKQTLADPTLRLAAQRRWTLAFRENYREVVRISRSASTDGD